MNTGASPRAGTPPALSPPCVGGNGYRSAGLMCKRKSPETARAAGETGGKVFSAEAVCKPAHFGLAHLTGGGCPQLNPPTKFTVTGSTTGGRAKRAVLAVKPAFFMEAA